MNVHQCAVLVIVLLWGAFAPQSLEASDYLLFTSAQEGSKIAAYQMNEEADLQLVREFKAGKDDHIIAVSPDNRTVVISAPTTPSLTTVFIKDDGTISEPCYDNPFTIAKSGWPFNPVCFHSSLPLFFLGAYPLIMSYTYDSRRQQVLPTGQQLALHDYNSINTGYSLWSNSIILQKPVNETPDAVQALRLTADGRFSVFSNLLILPVRANSYFKVSPDGRWAAATPQVGSPELMFIAISPDGTLTLSDTRDYPPDEAIHDKILCFSPDSRRLLMTSEGGRILTLFDIDPERGQLIERAILTQQDFLYDCSLPVGLTITPDGRYAAVRTGKGGTFHNWIHIVRLNDDGTMTYLPGMRTEVDHYIDAMAFTTLPHNAAGPEWALYE